MEFSEMIKDFYKIFFPKFLTLFLCWQVGRSTVPVDRTKGPVDRDGRPTCTDVHVC